MLLLLLNHVVLSALWKIDVYLISTLVNKSLYYFIFLLLLLLLLLLTVIISYFIYLSISLLNLYMFDSCCTPSLFLFVFCSLCIYFWILRSWKFTIWMSCYQYLFPTVLLLRCVFIRATLALSPSDEIPPFYNIHVNGCNLSKNA